MTDTAHSTPPANSGLRQVRARIILIGGILPVLIAVLATLLMLTWMGELPDPIAIHWGPSGVDGYGPAAGLLFVPLGMTALFSFFAVVSAIGAAAEFGITRTQKILLVSGLWLSIALSAGIAGSFELQRGLSDAAQAEGPLVPLLIGVLVGLAAAAGAWFLLPQADTIVSNAEDAEPLSVGKGEHLAWTRAVSISPFVLTILVVAVVLVAIVSILTLVIGNGGFWTSVASLALIVVVGSSVSYWRVTADRHGLSVRSIFGWPRIRVWADDIASARVIDVNAAGEFGGWGYRWAGKGRTGIILRDGQAIEVTKKNGKSFVVTVDDARTGARVLATVIARKGR